MSEGEVWKDVVGYDGRYKVSNKGNVYSVIRKDSRGVKRGGIILKPRYNRDGYLTVDLCKDGVPKRKSIHRLVAEVFIPNPNGLPQVNHIDEVKDNNNVDNLEWCTSEYNNSHGTRLERISKKVTGVNIKTGGVVTFYSTREAGRKGYPSVDKACRGVYDDGNGNLIGGDGRTYRGHRWYYQEEGE